MNPTDSNQPMHAILKPEQKQALSTAPGMSFLSDQERQKKVDELSQMVLRRVFQRVVHVLIDEDMKMISQLDKGDTTGNTVKYFLMTKVPNLEKIVQEEVEFIKKELQPPPVS